MQFLRSAVLGLSAVAAVALASPSMAVTVIKPIAGGPFSADNPIGTVLATRLLKSNTYDFTFSIVPPLGNSVLTTLSAAAADNANQGLPIQFSLFSGTPTGGHTLLDTSLYIINPTLVDTLGVGDYFLQVLPSGITRNGETGSGSLTVAVVPEPAAWGLFVVGFGMVGAATRRRRPTVAA